jgi:cyanophycinase
MTEGRGLHRKTAGQPRAQIRSRHWRSICATALVGLVLVESARAYPGTPEYGPARGNLVIAGGGSLAGTLILENFILLAGGSHRRFIIVPTAGGNRNDDGTLRVYDERQVVAPWIGLGVRNVRMLHTHDPKVADTEQFVTHLKVADAVWFDGGRQWNIVDSYMHTRTLAEFHRVLERGGVIGGSSAGATIQGEYLVRGDTSGSNVVMTREPNHQSGFKFLRRSAIDQHVDTRNRWSDLRPVIRAYPDLLGIGLSEDTAIVVTGDRFKVMGKGKVAVYDNPRKYWFWERPYFLLSPGNVYNMKARAIE